VIDADVDPSFVARDIIDSVRNRLAQFLVDEVVDPNGFGIARRPPLAPAVSEVTDLLFFLVATEMTGWPLVWNLRTCRLMCSNWALRSGCELPSRVLRSDCKL
jgi:hypothetical protein